MTRVSAASERLHQNAISRKTPFSRANLVVLQVACARFCGGRELVGAGALDDVYPDFVASDPLPGLIEIKSDIGCVKLPVADALPGAMPTFSVSASITRDVLLP